MFAALIFSALVYFGYFLNLLNLTPVGMMDGGRIVTALSRWLWLPGFALLLWFGWKYPNFIIWLIVLLSLPRIIRYSANEPKKNSVTSKLRRPSAGRCRFCISV